MGRFNCWGSVHSDFLNEADISECSLDNLPSEVVVSDVELMNGLKEALDHINGQAELTLSLIHI